MEALISDVMKQCWVLVLLVYKVLTHENCWGNCHPEHALDSGISFVQKKLILETGT